LSEVTRKRSKARSRRRLPRRSPEATRVFRLYVLESLDSRRTYVGVTKDLPRRLRQHNRELWGGARSTAGRQWRVVAVVGNFSSDGAALSVEKVMHLKGSRWPPLGPGARQSPLERRLDCLRRTLERVSARRFESGGPHVTVP